MKILRLLFALLSIAVLLAILLVPSLNRIQRDGMLALDGLGAPVEVTRDEKGMAFVAAESLPDALLAQGFVTAQDRIFQMHMTRLLVSGRLAEHLGEALLDTDRKMRTLGFYRIAEAHVQRLDEPTLAIFRHYAQGVNQFLAQPDSLPLEFALLGAQPQPWTIEDSVAIMYYMGWNSAANIDGELLAHALLNAVGAQRFESIAPLAINPDDQTLGSRDGKYPWNEDLAAASAMLHGLLQTGCCGDDRLRIGSNNWAIGAQRSESGMPIVANDPHLATDLLPTRLYPLGLKTPTLRAIGVNVAGLPGLIIGRNEHIAIGATNAYADTQDLYIETLDPNDSERYRDGDGFVPFERLDSPIRVRDKTAAGGYRDEPFSIRLTRRGPVVSDVLDIEADAEHVVSVRWTAAQTMRPALGLDYLLKARSVADVRAILRDATIVSLNMVFADVNGQLGWQTTGLVPRRNRDGGAPVMAPGGRDDWTGWVDYEQMPSRYEHPRGWVGTANHATVDASFPHYYSNWFSPRFRYQRLSVLLDGAAQSNAADSWRWMRDQYNGLAAELAPIVARHFMASEGLAELGAILADWDHHDHPDSAAALIFQQTMRRLIDAVFADELGAPLARELTSEPYFWQERLLRMVADGESVWFDDGATAETETLADVIEAAGLAARDSLVQQFGADATQWRWGDWHRMVVVNPLRRDGIGSQWLGGGDFAVGGSGETLHRGHYALEQDHGRVASSAALRMVVDLADDDKVMAVIPGGVSGRLFDPHYRDQLADYISGDVRYWWYSDAAIRQHATSTLRLMPETP